MTACLICHRPLSPEREDEIAAAACPVCALKLPICLRCERYSDRVSALEERFARHLDGCAELAERQRRAAW